MLQPYIMVVPAGYQATFRCSLANYEARVVNGVKYNDKEYNVLQGYHNNFTIDGLNIIFDQAFPNQNILRFSCFFIHSGEGNIYSNEAILVKSSNRSPGLSVDTRHFIVVLKPLFSSHRT